jgi:hypothetical protein
MRRKRKRNITEPIRVTPRRFVEIWQTSSSLAEVAAKCRLRKGACRTRACRYRQHGVRLKDFPPMEIVPTDWAELARYTEEIAGPAAAETGRSQTDG